MPDAGPSTSAPLALTLNGGSSSIKFALFSLTTPQPTRLFSGELERISPHQTENALRILDELKPHLTYSPLAAVGHRIVHGGPHLIEHQRITPAVLDELRKTISLDLAHLPQEIALIEAFQKQFPNIPQIACFDTAFHRDMPAVARMLPIPRRYFDAGIHKFGFHGLSYTYLLQRLTEIAGKEAAQQKIIFAHLGSGSSMAAVHNGKPIDTTMSFTPLAGLVMGTRTGDIDPGLLTYLMRTENLTPDRLDEFTSHQCGLLGISQISADMRDLFARRTIDPRANDAINTYCYSARKFIGSLAATLGGLDRIIFSGGIGEHQSEIRAEICEQLEFLGVTLHPQANAANRDIISSDQSKVIVHIIPTDEEIIIAQIIASILPRSLSTI